MSGLPKHLCHPGEGGGGHSLIYAIQICATPKGMVFATFPSENGYRLAHFGLEIGMVFEETTGVYKRIYRFNSK